MTQLDSTPQNCLLLVDDNPQNLEDLLAVSRLEDASFRVHPELLRVSDVVAVDEHKALENASRSLPHLLRSISSGVKWPTSFLIELPTGT
jgi:hypothetical protein